MPPEHRGRYRPVALRRLQEARPVEWPLTVNCRNTRPIAVQVSLLSGAPMLEVLAPEGPAAELTWYISADGQQQAISDRLKQLRREGFTARQITILSRYRFERSVAHAGLGTPLRDISRGGLDYAGDEIVFSTVSSFKGLEAEAVLLVDVDDLSSPDGWYLCMWVPRARESHFTSSSLNRYATNSWNTRICLVGVLWDATSRNHRVLVISIRSHLQLTANQIELKPTAGIASLSDGYIREASFSKC